VNLTASRRRILDGKVSDLIPLATSRPSQRVRRRGAHFFLHDDDEDDIEH
jgi:hypothetical protein